MTRKYKINLKLALLTGLIATVGFSGCKKYLDINQNPNNPENVEPTLLLPTVQAALGQVVGNSFQVYGNIWGQYWTQSGRGGQYKSLEQYNPVNTDFDYPWANLYGVALINADLILQNPASSPNLRGIAYLMKAYGFQLATDAFGDVPLSQALQPTKFINPKFDSQQTVYDSVFVYIEKAKLLLQKADVPSSIKAQDLIFQGDPGQWTAFANTLELRAYLRLAKKEPSVAQAGITALYATTPTFLTTDASITYLTTGGNENPFYNTEVALSTTNQNVVASSTAVNAFTRNNDPRLPLFYTLFIDSSPTPDSLYSIPQGSFISYVNKFISTPSPLVGAKADDPSSATGPVKLMSAAESDFLQAEAVSRGWTGGTGVARTLFIQGITDSFTAIGAGDPTNYIATAPDVMPLFTTNPLQAIITQKYYAMCGFQGFEAWTEWRRTGYPTFFVLSAATTLGTNQMPMRMLYPNSEETSNINYPGTIPITTPVWWGM